MKQKLTALTTLYPTIRRRPPPLFYERGFLLYGGVYEMFFEICNCENMNKVDVLVLFIEST